MKQVPEEQAKFEAQKLWASQLKKDYKPDEKDDTGNELYDSVMNKINSQGGNLHNIRGSKNINKVESSQGTIVREKIIKPMLAEKFEKYWGKHVNGKSNKPLYFNSENCYIQPKLDGIRGIAYIDEEGKVHITTRSGKEIVHNIAIKDELSSMLVGEYNTWNLDGEFYVHDLYDKNGNLLISVERFRIINGGCRSKLNNPSKEEKHFEFHVFDMFDPSRPNLIFKERHELLKKIFEQNTNSKIKFVDTLQLENPTKDDLWKMHDKYVEERYEGAMLKDKNNIYSGRREPTLLKMKPENEKEYIIVGGKSSEGTEKDCVVYKLETVSGHHFWCRPRGSFADKKRALRELNDDIGKKYTVYYQDIDDETEIPIHCRGKDLRYDL